MVTKRLQNVIDQAAKEGWEELKLDNMRITELPPEIGKLTKLVKLSFRFTKATKLPPEIGQLASLKFLNIPDNALTELPPEIGQLVNLKNLDLSHNKLTKVPREIGHLSELRGLWLDDNELTELPPEIGQLAKLQNLVISNNKLTQLPPEICQLSNLIKVDVDHNYLTKLPKRKGRLPLEIKARLETSVQCSQRSTLENVSTPHTKKWWQFWKDEYFEPRMDVPFTFSKTADYYANLSSKKWHKGEVDCNICGLTQVALPTGIPKKQALLNRLQGTIDSGLRSAVPLKCKGCGSVICLDCNENWDLKWKCPRCGGRLEYITKHLPLQR